MLVCFGVIANNSTKIKNLTLFLLNFSQIKFQSDKYLYLKTLKN